LDVFALVGASGTGKSHRAVLLAHKYNADLIIDDGLLIKDKRILAGTSAKRQPTRIGAIKSALFMNEEIYHEVKNALFKINPQRVLILGTSEKMVKRISQRLNLPEPVKIIRIEDIASLKEIRKARYTRTLYGKHVIPAPTVEVKKTFPKTIIDSLQIFLHRKDSYGAKSWLEQSVVRPTFTSYGKFFITKNALVNIVSHTLKMIDGIDKPGRVDINASEDGIVIKISPTMRYGMHLGNLGKKAQYLVRRQIENMTNLNVKAINVYVKELSFY